MESQLRARKTVELSQAVGAMPQLSAASPAFKLRPAKSRLSNPLDELDGFQKFRFAMRTYVETQITK